MRLHHLLYLTSRGWIGHRSLGVTVLVLHAVGRRSGAPRTSSLVYCRDGRDLLVVGSNGGEAADPAWVHNVRAHPDVEVWLGRRHVACTATVLDDGGPDHDRAFALADRHNHGRYRRYQARTTRRIPVVRLVPRVTTTPAGPAS